jgi:hypothetical protein
MDHEKIFSVIVYSNYIFKIAIKHIDGRITHNLDMSNLNIKSAVFFNLKHPSRLLIFYLIDNGTNKEIFKATQHRGVDPMLSIQ